MTTEYRTAPASGCQLNSGRASEVASPSGPRSANLALESGAPPRLGACDASATGEVRAVGDTDAMLTLRAPGDVEAPVRVNPPGELGIADAVNAAVVIGEPDTCEPDTWAPGTCATGTCATDTAAALPLARGFSWPHHTTVEPTATTMMATDAAMGNVNPRRRLRRSGARGLGPERAAPGISLLRARRSSSSTRQASHASR